MGAERRYLAQSAKGAKFGKFEGKKRKLAPPFPVSSPARGRLDRGRVSTASKLLMPQGKNLRAAGDRIEGLLQELGSCRRSPGSCKRRRIGPAADGAVWLGVGPDPGDRR